MNWARYKLLLISGGISLIISVALVFWILSSLSASRELDQSVQRLEGQQTTLISADLYPSETNLTALEQEQEKVEELRDRIKSLIREGQLDAQPVRRSVFGDYINEVVPDLREAAAAAKKGGGAGVILRDPDFGMTAFLEGTLPPQREINELVVEIETIKHVALMLFDSGISELVTIQVVGEEELPGTRGAARQPAFGRRNQRADSGSTDPDAENGDMSDVETQRERLFDVVHVKAEFKIYEDFFWQALNAILADPNQLVPSSISITNGNTLLWPEYLNDPMTGAQRSTRRERRAPSRRSTPENDLLSMLSGGGETPPPSEEETKEQQLGLRERQQNIIGADLLNVVIELKAYRLKPDAETATQPEGI